MGRRLLGLALGLVMVGSGLLAGTTQRVSAGEFCFGSPPTIYAQGGVTNGTSGRDVILGSHGDDIINGGGGDDLICDNYGSNIIHGGSGNDWIEGRDALYGDSGNDTLYGGEYTNSIDGGSGDDYIFVSGGNEILVIVGGSGSDYIETLYAVAIFAGAGNDSIYVGGQVNGNVDCGSGRDRTYLDVVLGDIISCEGDLIN